MPTGWRIVKSARVANAFDGEGARQYGGRWNSPGTAMIYTAHTESLTALEILVHLQASPLLGAYASIPASFDAALIEVADPTRLPADWRSSPASPALQGIGDRWVVEARSAVLRVPSAIVPNEPNFLLNPAHPRFGEISIGALSPFELDPRFE